MTLRLVFPAIGASLMAFAITARCDAAAKPEAGERAYIDANDASMARMMSGMAVQPSGDVDRDFVAMMVPHHQGAIDMAEALVKYGKDERLKRIAQEIIVTQHEEIVAMQRIADAPRASGTSTGSMP